MKLAKNSKLEANLKKQVEIYQAAADAERAIKVIIYFSYAQLTRVRGVLKRLQLDKHSDIVLLDARNDNKHSASNA